MKQSREAMSLKARIVQIAKMNKVTAQSVMQNFLFERFLARLSKSEFKEKFVVKGGMLIASIVGIGTRSTMDLDTTLRNMPLTESVIMNTIQKICAIEMDDNVSFSDFMFEPIRKDDAYGGFRLKMMANFFTIKNPLSIDISTGDAITPEPIEYDFPSIFDEFESIKIYGYNVESIIAEKLETILSRGTANTRPRDFYDVYILQKKRRINVKRLHEALNATTKHRETQNILNSAKTVMDEIKISPFLKGLWEKYRKQYPYAKDLDFDTVTKSVEMLIEKIAKEN